MNFDYVRSRITEFRLRKNVSEYQMSYDLGQSKGYIQSISSGRALPSLPMLFKICDYFEITPKEFFDEDEKNPQLAHKIAEEAKYLKDEDLILILSFIKRLRN